MSSDPIELLVVDNPDDVELTLRALRTIVKTVDFEQFTQAVADLGLYWLAYNTLPASIRSPSHSP